MALSEEDSRRFGRFGTDYARTVTHVEGITDAAITAAVAAQHAAELLRLSPPDRQEAIDTMVRVCRRRLEAMNRVTIADQRRKS